MDNINTGGPAYPNPRWEGWGSPQEGMTLRDYFAAKALQAVIADKDTAEIFENSPEANSITFFDFSAITAYAFADAMLKVREQ
jgi:hypothetical protein